jgi:hypothetical protein
MPRVNGKAPGGRGIWPIVVVGELFGQPLPTGAKNPEFPAFDSTSRIRDRRIRGSLILGFPAYPTGGAMGLARQSRFLRADRVRSCGKGHNTYLALRP